ncbi:MAG: MFS transporter [Planctomycetota bacterium]|nr:MFS transporter [Planctomycetota bacterium]
MASLIRNYQEHWRLASKPARRYLFGAVLMGFAQAVTWSLLARYLDARGFTKGEVGSILASDALGKTLIALPAALWLARRSVRRTFMVAACLGGGAYFAMPFVEPLWGLRALNMFAGMCLAVHYVVIAPFLFRHTGPRERASIFGLAEAIRTTASVVGALLAGLLVSYLMGMWLEPDATAELLAKAEADATGYAIMAAGLTSILAALVYRTISDQREELPEPQPFWSIAAQHRGVIARFALPQLFIAAGSGFCIPFLPLYFKDRFGFAPDAWGQMFAGGQVLMTFGLLASPWILSKLGYVRSIVFIELASLPFFLMLALTMNMPLAATAFLLRGALMNSTHPIHKNLMMNATPPQVREVQTGINATLWGLGWVIGPQVGGYVLEGSGNDYSLLMYTTMGCYTIAAALTYVMLIPLERCIQGESA